MFYLQCWPVGSVLYCFLKSANLIFYYLLKELRSLNMMEFLAFQKCQLKNTLYIVLPLYEDVLTLLSLLWEIQMAFIEIIVTK